MRFTIARLVFVGAGIILFLPSNVSAQWTQIEASIGRRITAFAVDGTNIAAGSLDSGIYLSTDYGITWTCRNSGLPPSFTNFGLWKSFNVCTLEFFDHVLFLGSTGIYYSSNCGLTWDTSVVRNSVGFSSFVKRGKILFGLDYIYDIVISTNNGLSWSKLHSDDIRDAEQALVCLAGNDSALFCGTGIGGRFENNGSIYRSTDSGKHWKRHLSIPGYGVFGYGQRGRDLFAGTSKGIYRSIDNGIHWIHINKSPKDYVHCFVFKDNCIFAGTGHGVYQSTDDGNHWIPINNGMPKITVTTLAIVGDFLFAGTYDEGLWKRSIQE